MCDSNFHPITKQEHSKTNQLEGVRKTAKQGAPDVPSLSPAKSSSKKRSSPASIVSTSTKKLKVADCTTVNPSSSSSSSTVRAEPGKSIDQCYWEEWDIKREGEFRRDPQVNHFIKAVRVWNRLLKSPGLVSSRIRDSSDKPAHHVNKLVTMVLAVTNNHAFKALKRVMVSLRQDRVPSMSDVFGDEPQTLVKTVTALEGAGDLYGYMRRIALARLAKLYRTTAANEGQLAIGNDDTWLNRRRQTNKADKAKAYCTMIERIWGVAFPARFKGNTMTKSGLIDSEDHDAVEWNKYKRKFVKQIEAGNRWLGWAERLGWLSLGLISCGWAIGGQGVATTDKM